VDEFFSIWFNFVLYRYWQWKGSCNSDSKTFLFLPVYLVDRWGIPACCLVSVGLGAGHSLSLSWIFLCFLYWYVDEESQYAVWSVVDSVPGTVFLFPESSFLSCRQMRNPSMLSGQCWTQVLALSFSFLNLPFYLIGRWGIPVCCLVSGGVCAGHSLSLPLIFLSILQADEESHHAVWSVGDSVPGTLFLFSTFLIWMLAEQRRF
jgi:hypothetical protein